MTDIVYEYARRPYTYEELNAIARYEGNNGRYGITLNNKEVTKETLLRLTEDGRTIGFGKDFFGSQFNSHDDKVQISLMLNIHLDKNKQSEEIKNLRNFE